MSIEKPRILIAAGGTGGHVFPALAIADEIKKLRSNTEFLFVGTKEKIEAQVVPQRGYACAFIWISGFQRSIKVGNLLFPLKVVVSLVQSFFLIRKFKPDIVLGTGGYVCGPVLYLASLLKIKIIIHESNSYPGITTRLLSTRATKVFVAFETTSQWLKRKDNVQLTGTPIRNSLGTVSREDGIRFFRLDSTKRTLLVFGGSLGASSINQAVKTIAIDLTQAGIQLIWQTGKTNESMIEEMKKKSIGWIGSFIDAMEFAYAAADVVICRAGATTLAELTQLGKASILIPYPYAAADHQTYNAKTLVNVGAAIMIANQDVRAKLKNELLALLADDTRRQKMGQACKLLGKPDAGAMIAQQVLHLI